MPRSLNHSRLRRLTRYATRMRGGARRPRAADDLAEIFRCFGDYVRACRQMAHVDPHLFGPETRA